MNWNYSSWNCKLLENNKINYIINYTKTLKISIKIIVNYNTRQLIKHIKSNTVISIEIISIFCRNLPKKNWITFNNNKNSVIFVSSNLILIFIIVVYNNRFKWTIL